ncbi:MAG: hypothetical protein OHK0012_12040 [Synechococcales cyanobacterium]
MAYSPLVIHLDQGSLSLPMSPTEAATLDHALQQLMQAIQAAQRTPKVVQANLETRLRGTVDLELFCNPNIWPTVHGARILLTLKAPPIKLSIEVALTQFVADLSEFQTQF